MIVWASRSTTLASSYMRCDVKDVSAITTMLHRVVRAMSTALSCQTEMGQSPSRVDHTADQGRIEARRHA